MMLNGRPFKTKRAKRLIRSGHVFIFMHNVIIIFSVVSPCRVASCRLGIFTQVVFFLALVYPIRCVKFRLLFPFLIIWLLLCIFECPNRLSVIFCVWCHLRIIDVVFESFLCFKCSNRSLRLDNPKIFS